MLPVTAGRWTIAALHSVPNAGLPVPMKWLMEQQGLPIERLLMLISCLS